MRNQIEPHQYEDAAELFKALADPARLRILVLLSEQERNVGELADMDGEKLGTVSARLQLLLQARLVKKRRDGKAIIYAIADQHIINLVENAIEHACEHH